MNIAGAALHPSFRGNAGFVRFGAPTAVHPRPSTVVDPASPAGPRFAYQRPPLDESGMQGSRTALVGPGGPYAYYCPPGPRYQQPFTFVAPGAPMAPGPRPSYHAVSAGHPVMYQPRHGAPQGYGQYWGQWGSDPNDVSLKPVYWGGDGCGRYQNGVGAGPQDNKNFGPSGPYHGYYYYPPRNGHGPGHMVGPNEQPYHVENMQSGYENQGSMNDQAGPRGRRHRSRSRDEREDNCGPRGGVMSDSDRADIPNDRRGSTPTPSLSGSVDNSDSLTDDRQLETGAGQERYGSEIFEPTMRTRSSSVDDEYRRSTASPMMLNEEGSEEEMRLEGTLVYVTCHSLKALRQAIAPLVNTAREDRVNMIFENARRRILRNQQVTWVVMFKTRRQARAVVRYLGGQGHDARLADEPELAYTNIYIANLPSSVNQNDVERYVSKYGTLTSVKMLKDGDGNGLGVAFANLSTPGEAVNAIRGIHNQKIDGWDSVPYARLAYRYGKSAHIARLLRIVSNNVSAAARGAALRGRINRNIFVNPEEHYGLFWSPPQLALMSLCQLYRMAERRDDQMNRRRNNSNMRMSWRTPAADRDDDMTDDDDMSFDTFTAISRWSNPRPTRLQDCIPAPLAGSPTHMRFGPCVPHLPPPLFPQVISAGAAKNTQGNNEGNNDEHHEGSPVGRDENDSGDGPSLRAGSQPREEARGRSSVSADRDEVLDLTPPPFSRPTFLISPSDDETLPIMSMIEQQRAVAFRWSTKRRSWLRSAANLAAMRARSHEPQSMSPSEVSEAPTSSTTKNNYTAGDSGISSMDDAGNSSCAESPACGLHSSSSASTLMPRRQGAMRYPHTLTFHPQQQQ